MTQYDVIVIGTGSAGGSVIWPLHDAGMKVATVERELVGGLCAYWGCMPSKTLLRPDTVVWEARHSVGTGEPGLQWPEIARYRDYMVRNWDDRNQVKELKDAGIAFYRGDARITGAGEVSVNGETLNAPRLVIATGSKAVVPPIDGLDSIDYWTNREGTELNDIPHSVIVIGGGAIGCELGQMLHSYGAEVSIVEATDHLLPEESPEAAGHLADRMRETGITLQLGRKATRFEKTEDGSVTHLDNGNTIRAQIVLVATGRGPNVDGLGLDTIGIQPGERGLHVDEYCRAGENVWAAGDVTGVAGFTHVADYQGAIVVDDILGHPRPANYDAIPAVVYTDPEVASVGISSPKKAPEGMDLVEAHVDLNAAARTETYGKGFRGGLTVCADRASGTVVGAWAVGPLAGEWIQFATLAIRGRVPVTVLDDTILAFPTFTRLYLEPFRELKKQLA